jgi:hypothetical protein
LSRSRTSPSAPPTFIERREGLACIADGARWPNARVLKALPQFAKGVDRLASLDAAPEEYRELQAAPSSGFARMGFIDALARLHLADVHAEVLRFGRSKRIGLEDPVFAGAFARMPALAELDDGGAAGAATFDDYCTTGRMTGRRGQTRISRSDIARYGTSLLRCCLDGRWKQSPSPWASVARSMRKSGARTLSGSRSLAPQWISSCMSW